jgi:hypothetical protein
MNDALRFQTTNLKTNETTNLNTDETASHLKMNGKKRVLAEDE